MIRYNFAPLLLLPAHSWRWRGKIKKKKKVWEVQPVFTTQSQDFELSSLPWKLDVFFWPYHPGQNSQANRETRPGSHHNCGYSVQCPIWFCPSNQKIQGSWLCGRKRLISCWFSSFTQVVPIRKNNCQVPPRGNGALAMNGTHDLYV